LSLEPGLAKENLDSRGIPQETLSPALKLRDFFGLSFFFGLLYQLLTKSFFLSLLCQKDNLYPCFGV
jgi:hypothetical protein